jgi:hypothetical protein
LFIFKSNLPYLIFNYLLGSARFSVDLLIDLIEGLLLFKVHVIECTIAGTLPNWFWVYALI